MHWREAISAEWAERQGRVRPTFNFPLNQQTFDFEEISAMVEVMLNGTLTMGAAVERFESEFAQKVGAPFAVMVNSGSSANLLAVATSCSSLRNTFLKPGDEVLVPAVCWSTSIFPLMQYGLVPKFVDVETTTLNMSSSAINAAMTEATKAIMVVHVMGNCTDISATIELAKQKGLVVIEDTCEALGTLYEGRYLGTFGDFGTYSFYFSHHMTTGEGGMVTCKSSTDRDLLKSLRAHGWTRELPDEIKRSWEAKYPAVDSRFMFINIGYNLRPMEFQGAMGSIQLRKLDVQNRHRVRNFLHLRDLIEGHPDYRKQFTFMEVSNSKVEPCWFGFPCLLHPDWEEERSNFLSYLSANSVENRPILTGNFLLQPCMEFCRNDREQDYPGANSIHRLGFFIGINALVTDTEAELEKLADILCHFFVAEHL